MAVFVAEHKGQVLCRQVVDTIVETPFVGRGCNIMVMVGRDNGKHESHDDSST
jgi:hypothetical protein